MAYATPEDISPYVKQHATQAGQFGDLTTPTRAHVTQFIEDVSALVNVVIRQNNLTVSEGSDLYKAVVAFVKGQVADLVLMVNNSGRFSPAGRVAGERPDMRSAYAIITSDAKKFLADYAAQTGVGPGEGVARVVMF